MSSLPISVYVTQHAVERFCARNAGFPLDPKRHRTGVVRAIQQHIRKARPLSPSQRAVVAHPKRGIDPADELLLYDSLIFVLTRKAARTEPHCVTVIGLTPAQLETIEMLEASPNAPAALPGGTEAADAPPPVPSDAFVARLATFFCIENPEDITDLRVAMPFIPESRRVLLRRLPLLHRFSRNVTAHGLDLFWDQWRSEQDAASQGPAPTAAAEEG